MRLRSLVFAILAAGCGRENAQAPLVDFVGCHGVGAIAGQLPDLR
jgi:hypothetical protein